ncbi:MAG: DUF6562 domain-containing protein [Porphyromonas endodontalis]|uniref:DUF6562 domain-containing protein n=1 Tax=Porphyromonas endodontalis TaxID=28124 RepID=UPI003F9FC695
MNQKIKFFLASLAMLLVGVSCQRNDQLGSNDPGKVVIKLSLPEDMQALRASANSSSAKGGITNVDMSQYDIRYKLAVYNANNDLVIAPMIKTVDSYEEITYELRLTPNRQYKFVVWADFVQQGQTTDLHYNTSDFLNITCLDAADKQLNDETRDAYWIAKEINVGTTAINETLVLRRPFSKIRVVTTDWGLVPADKPDYFSIQYYGTDCKRFNSMNLLTGVSTGTPLTAKGDASIVTYDVNVDKDNKDYKLGYDSDEHNRTMTVDYLMTDKSEQTPLHVVFTAKKGGAAGQVISTYDFTVNVPIQRNYLTTLMGNLLTTATRIKVVIEENFVEEYNNHQSWFAPQGVTPKEPTITTSVVAGTTIKTYHITNREELMWLADTPGELGANKIFKLESDIDMNGIDWFPIGHRNGAFGGPCGTFDGNGHTLRNFSVQKFLYKTGGLFKKEEQTGVFGEWYGDIKNLTFENITINGLEGVKVEPGNTHNESAYFAGCIGYFCGNLDNVHAKNVFIKGANSWLKTQNVGGLVGYTNPNKPFEFKECSVMNITIQAKGTQIGGMVGSLHKNHTLTKCTANYVSLRVNGSTTTNIAGLVGDIADATGVKFDKCKVENVEFLKYDGTINSDYAPTDPLYGTSRKGTPTIVR